MKKNIFYLISVVITLVACETVVDVNVPMRPPKLTLNGLFTPDSIWRVKLNRSKYILDEGGYSPIENAEVIVYENGLAYDTLQETNYGYYVSPSGKKPLLNKTYEIKSAAEGFENIQANSSLPDTMFLKSIKYSSIEGTTTNQQSFNYNINITFKDDSESENFYEITLYQDYWYLNYQTMDTIYRNSRVYAFTDDPNLSELSTGNIIFNDNLFNGKEIIVAVKGIDYRQNQNSGKLYLHIQTLSKELYKYKITSSLQANTSGDPFAQPVHVFNNINNGFGIFGGYNETVYEIER